MENLLKTIHSPYIKYFLVATFFILALSACDSVKSNSTEFPNPIEPIETKNVPSPIPTTKPNENKVLNPISTPTTAPAALFYYSRAFRLLEMELWDESIVAFGPVIAMLPNMPHGFHGRGKAYLNKDVYEYALNDFESAIKIDQEFGPVYVDRARLYLKKKQTDLATQDLQKALEFLHPIRHKNEINSANLLKNEIQSLK